jgi:hypothetical protein
MEVTVSAVLRRSNSLKRETEMATVLWLITEGKIKLKGKPLEYELAKSNVARKTHHTGCFHDGTTNYSFFNSPSLIPSGK